MRPAHPDIRIQIMWLKLQRVHALRAQRPGGATVTVKVTAHQEGITETVPYRLYFRDGRLASVGLGGDEKAEVEIECQRPAWGDFLGCALSAAEGRELGRFELRGATEAVDAAMAELDATETLQAVAAADRELYAARMALLQAGRITRPILDVDIVLHKNLPKEAEEQIRLIHDEWATRTQPEKT